MSKGARRSCRAPFDTRRQRFVLAFAIGIVAVSLYTFTHMQSFIRFITLASIFLVPAVVFIVSESMFFPYITGKNFTFRILVEIATVGWALLALKDAQYRPKRSWILGIFVALLGAMAISDTLSPSPLKSFMSNFERMDGFVTLAHTFLYFVVVSCMITGKTLWRMFFGWLVALAGALSLLGIMQASGSAAVSQGASWRVDGTLGNSTYMAVYMLFSAAIAGMFAFREKIKELRWGSLALIALFTFLIFQTGTRGTVLGLVGGFGVALGYLTSVGVYRMMKGEAVPQFLKISAGLLISGLVLVGGFVAARNTSFVQNTPALERLTHISLSEGGYRFVNWGMAWQGVKEKPVFGWGHESFNYVFNKYYDPGMYGAEEWYDRAHDIVFDWLVQGGFVGAGLYFGLLAVAAYYLMRKPRTYMHADVEGMSLVERTLLLGLLVAYTIHNIFVFDNVVSYIYFAIILAYIHQRVAARALFSERVVADAAWTQIAVPVGAIALGAAIYFVNAAGIAAAQDIIVAYSKQTVAERTDGFEKALAEKSFANQEIREQLLQFIPKGVEAAQGDVTLRDRLLKLGHEQVQEQIAEKPGDARIHILAAGYYRQVNNLAEALHQYETALTLTPNKTSLLQETGMTYVNASEFEKGLGYLKQAFDQDQTKVKSRLIYATGLIYAGKMDEYDTLTAPAEVRPEVLAAEYIYSALYSQKQFGRMQAMYAERAKLLPGDFGIRKNLAVVYYNDGKIAKAIEVLETAQKEMQLTDEQKKQVTMMIATLKEEALKHR